MQLSTRKSGFQAISRKMPLLKVSKLVVLKKVAHGVSLSLNAVIVILGAGHFRGHFPAMKIRDCS